MKVGLLVDGLYGMSALDVFEDGWAGIVRCVEYLARLVAGFVDEQVEGVGGQRSQRGDRIGGRMAEEVIAKQPG